MSLSAEQRDVLELLAGYPHGATEELFVFVHHFNRDTIAGLVHDGLVAAKRESMKAGGKTIEVVRITITAAGQDALGRHAG
jgi:hypothetical protein